MVKYNHNIHDVLGALSDPTRSLIMEGLIENGEMAMGEIAKPFSISLPAVSKHLRVLERSGLVNQRRDGRYRRYSFNPKALRETAKWLEFHFKFWNSSLDRLEKLINKNKKYA